MILTDRQLTTRFRLSNDSKYTEAYDYVESLVPKIISFGRCEYHHFPTHYKAKEKRFAYFNVESGDFVFLNAEEIKHLPTPPI